MVMAADAASINVTGVANGESVVAVRIYTVFQKNVTTFLMISWTRHAHLQIFLVHILLRVWAIDRCFYFPTLSILCTYFTLENWQDLNISKIKQNHENFTGTCHSNYKSLSVKAVWCTKAVEWIAWQGLETLKHQQSAEENPQDGYIVRHCRQR